MTPRQVIVVEQSEYCREIVLLLSTYRLTGNEAPIAVLFYRRMPKDAAPTNCTAPRLI